MADEKKDDFFEDGEIKTSNSSPVTPGVKVTSTPKEKAKKKIVIKNPAGEEVSQKDYFYSSKGEDSAPTWFEKVCGKPVDREDMITVFNKVFRPSDGMLFYKAPNKEVYIVIVPLKHSQIIGLEQDSVEGDCEKHAMSFINEGSVNLDTLRLKLNKIASTIRIVDR